MDLGLEGKRALVTGGSRGIGRAIVLGLAQSGATVAACYNRESDDVKRLRGELEQVGGDSYLTQADVSDAASVQRFVGEAGERLGGLDIVINNAGVVSHAMIEQLELDEWHRVIDTNLTAVYLVAKAALPLMGDGGSIVNITSAVAMRGMPARTHYISSKAGLIGLTRALCKEVGRRGIRVNALAPGIIETDQTSDLDDAGRARYSGLAALNRLGSPEEIAAATLFLASDRASFISGVTLNVDGGI
ncbi:MAG TPA: 3-oxoacyl-ACP reductase family protein [Solirubrobacteraceae bacterium]|nr:3-oxoacyl-ACP reductase family protein [Solirubrobacteraceae bacterium]